MKRSHVAVFVFALFASSAYAATIQFSLNTSSIAGTTGSIDFQFNPGGASSQAATVLISNFAGGLSAGPAQHFGNASGGPVPNAITINNTQADNEDFEPFTFGSSLKFNLLFSGPAVVSPNGTSTAASQFTFSLFSDAAGTIPVLTPDPAGIAGTVTVNLDGTLTSHANSSSLVIAAVPEPASLGLTAAALLMGLGLLRLRRSNS
jgi:hypothetical protein